MKTLTEVANVSAGNPAPKDVLAPSEGLVPFVRTSDVGQIRLGTIKTTRDWLSESVASKMKIFRRGAILFPKSGASTFNNYRVALGMDSCVASHLAVLTPQEDKMNSDFLRFFLETVDSKDLLQDSSYPSLRLSDIGQIRTPAPPLAEQERIVEVLDEAFAAIDKAKANLERNFTNARELFQSRLNDIFSNPSEDWEAKPLGEAFKFQGGTQPPKSKFIFEPKDGYVRLLQIRDFSREDKKVFIPEESSNRRCNAEDILIGRYGASVGKICSGLAGAFNVALVKVVPRIEVDRRFSQFYFKSPEFQRPLSEVSSRGAQDGFNVEGIRNFLFPIPPLEEQERIVIELDSLDEMKRGLETKYQCELDNLEELRQSILEQAFKGKLTEPVAA